MSLEENKVIDFIEVTIDNVIQVRTKHQILKDGVEISYMLHRHSLNPGDDLSNEDPKVIAIANAVWTPEVIENYRQKILKIDEQYSLG